jgi:hypothetical protein
MSQEKSNDITSWFVGQLIQNGRTSVKANLYSMAPGVAFGPGVGVGGAAAKLYWFKRQVQNGGPWDFKNNYLKSYKDTGVSFNGVEYRYDMPGNFHYGYVGAAAGIGDSLLKYAAGQAQLKAGTSKGEFYCTDFDDPEDQAYIILGIALWDDHGLKITAANVAAKLAKFSPAVCTPPSGAAKTMIDRVIADHAKKK